MDKQKEIEEMARKICKSSSVGCNFPTCSKCGIKDTCKARTYATRAVNAGYGDVKQAVREFAEKLYDNLIEVDTKDFGRIRVIGEDAVDELVKEVCGE